MSCGRGCGLISEHINQTLSILSSKHHQSFMRSLSPVYETEAAAAEAAALLKGAQANAER